MTKFTVGRGEDATVTIPHPSISRVHLEAQVLDRTTLRLRDLGSTNGSFVQRGGKPVRFMKETVSMGDHLVIGSKSISVADLVAMADQGIDTGRADEPVSIYIRGSDGSFGRKN